MSLVDLGPKNVNFSAYRRRFRAFEKEFVYLRLGIHLLTYEFRHIAFYARLHSRNLVNFIKVNTNSRVVRRLHLRGAGDLECTGSCVGLYQSLSDRW